MLERLSQWKSPLVFITLMSVLAGCAWKRHDVTGPDELITTFSNNWFKKDKNHSLVDTMNEPLPHIMFDTTPEFTSTDHTVNVVLTVPQDSPHSYAIDLNSGQRYYTHTYCKQKDVWNSYSGSIDRPVFSIGYIPRVLDQLGEPQKVIVFSNRKNFAEVIATNYFKVKLIGAYVEQICPEGNCLGKNNWLSKMVFLAVDNQDSGLTSIANMSEMRSKLNWEKVKAYLGNIDGRNFIGDITYPSTRIGEPIEYEEAFDYFKKRSIFMTDAEIKKIQNGCHALYDLLWDEAGKERPEDKPAMTMKELSEKVKLQESLRKAKKPVGFAARFKKFTKKYFREISTCERFVYHGNINLDRERFWFLSYVGIYYRLHREGYYFNCKNKSWQRNVLNDEGKPIFNIQEDLQDCREQEFDQAMDYIPNFLTGLKSEKEYFRFIDYDNHPFGTHHKLYSWVKVKNRKYDCENDPNVEIKKEMRVFPEDVSWKARNIKDIADKEKIIY